MKKESFPIISDIHKSSIQFWVYSISKLDKDLVCSPQSGHKKYFLENSNCSIAKHPFDIILNMLKFSTVLSIHHNYTTKNVNEKYPLVPLSFRINFSINAYVFYSNFCAEKYFSIIANTQMWTIQFGAWQWCYFTWPQNI